MTPWRVHSPGVGRITLVGVVAPCVEEISEARTASLQVGHLEKGNDYRRKFPETYRAPLELPAKY